MKLKLFIPTFLPLLALAVLLAFAAVPEAAEAGTYTVYFCRTPEGSAAPLTEWRVDKGQFPSILNARDNCPNGPYELEMSPAKTHPADDLLSATVQAPAGAEIVAYKAWRSAQVASNYSYRYHELTPFGAAPEQDECFASAGCTSKGDPSQPFGQSNLVYMLNRSGVTGLEFLLTCALPDSSSEKCPATAPGAKFELFGAELTMADSSSPVIPIAPSGPLVLPAAHLSGSEPVTISATDTGSGVYQAMLEIDGTIVQTSTLDENGGLCKPPYVSVEPCKLSATGTISLDTSTLSDGTHSLRILVSDATGTNVTSWGPVTIHTDNGRCNPTPVTKEMDMKVRVAAHGKRESRAITTRFGQGATVRGRLVGSDGKPVPGAEVCVAERQAAGTGPLHRTAIKTTDAHGFFTYKVKKGTSRRVFFVHRTGSGAVVGSVAVRVRAPVELHGYPLSLVNGQTLTMRGRLLSPPYPKRGALVELQAYRETGWQTFATTNSNRRGRFAYRYTFSRTTGVQHYLLRARVPKQEDYPFEAGSSHPIKVTVAGAGAG
jgi:hypothetical protein